MSCESAITDSFVTVSPVDMVDAALKKMEKAGVDTAAVVETDGTLVGIFSLQILIKGLLPVSVAVSGTIPLDVKIPAAPGIAKRLSKIHVVTVGQLMETKLHAVGPDDPLWEAINTLTQYGSPLLVVDPQNSRFLGAITLQSAFTELLRLKDES